VILVFLFVTHQSPKHIEYLTMPPVWLKKHMIENCDDVGDEPLREAMKNMLVEDIKPKDDEDDVQIVNPPSSSHVPQDDDKNERIENEDTHVSHEQAEAQAQDVDAPQPSSQVVDRRNL
jgi:hypothetical protein